MISKKQNRKLKFIRQHDSMQCGVACLAMICHYYGKSLSQTYLDSISQPTIEGVSMYGISETAKRIGLNTICAIININNLQKKLPCILHWNQNHFVILYKINRKGTRFYIADPGNGLLSYSYDEFVRCWGSCESNGETKGIAMFVEPTEEFGTNTDEATSTKRSFRFLIGYLNQYRKYFIQIISGLFIGCILQLILPFLTQSIVDIGIKHSDIT